MKTLNYQKTFGDNELHATKNNKILMKTLKHNKKLKTLNYKQTMKTMKILNYKQTMKTMKTIKTINYKQKN